MPTRGSKDPNGRALRGRRAHTTFALLTDPARQIWNSFNNRANAGGADAPEAAVNGCLYDRFKSLYNKTATKPSLVIVPARFKSGTLYSQIPSSNADFTVTRPLNTATRFDSSALIQTGITSGVPRLDYYTSGGVTGCPALLVEPAATNGILNSADTITNWALGANLTSGSIDVIGVSGNNLTVATSGGTISSGAGRLARASNNVALASGSTYTISFFLKQTATHTIGGYQAVITGAASGSIGSGFNVSGTFSSGEVFANANIVNRIRRVERWGTDVFRCSETFTMSASGTLTNFNFAPLTLTTSASNSAIGTQLGFAAPQIELGSVPTSFIPTTTGSVTRNADVISVSGAVSGSIGQASGTIYVEAYIRKISDAIVVAIMNTGIADAIYLQVQSNGNLFARIRNSGSIVDLSIAAANWSEGYHKVAIAYALGAGNSAICIDGGTPVTGTIVNMPACKTMVLGSRPDSPGTLSLTDRIRAAALYTTRLTNDELALITQP